jgi:small-conductance mechanosensitive channel
MWADIQDRVIELWADHRFRAGTIVLGSFVAGYIIEFLFRRIFMALAAQTKTDLDDKIVAALRRPIFWSVIFIGLAWATSLWVTSGQFVIYGVLKTLALFLWTLAGIRVGDAILTSASRQARPHGMIQERTKPVFDMAIKLVLISAALYFTFLAWDINVSAWLASAGIIGIAVGFAAQDTLANLIAGIAILADGIYKVGDFVVLDNEGTLRGKVTRIGMRSTRVLTLDNVEITVPNDMISKSKIINEVGGPHVRQRIRARVSAAYGSDVDQVFAVLGSCADGVDGVSPDPTPRVRFREFGGSGLEFELLVWIAEPSRRDFIISDLNVRIYKAFDAAGIEIPYSKHDVYIKEMPDQKPGQRI